MSDEGFDAGHRVAPVPAGRLTARRERLGSTVLVVLAGELDLDSLAPADEALERALADGPARVVVDLAELGFCDSSGLNLLLRTRIAAQEAEIELRLAAAPDGQFGRLLELTGAGAVFSLHASVPDALADA
ncbi:STAS domain-containing protein [Kitasatospora sp. NPDC048540]|uniref:STAS domain-containing protein n=1 Tax=unclassified Kitasatospora TaxID=2633591 RepID=UPI000539816E|nr:STAS domain-containing protein [Kitasatospora sp. MBT63]